MPEGVQCAHRSLSDDRPTLHLSVANLVAVEKETSRTPRAPRSSATRPLKPAHPDLHHFILRSSTLSTNWLESLRRISRSDRTTPSTLGRPVQTTREPASESTNGVGWVEFEATCVITAASSSQSSLQSPPNPYHCRVDSPATVPRTTTIVHFLKNVNGLL